MSASYCFTTDAQSDAFLKEIIAEMIVLFSISEDEAVIRINSSWSKVGSFTGESHIFYHEDPIFYARDIYYGHDSFWWITGDERKEKNLPLLKPISLK